jgi:transcriptional adapter 2-alpha
VFSNLHFPLFVNKWSAEEEMLLVEGLMLYGFGNWADVGDHVGTKNEDECFDHYQALYVVPEDFPVPLGMEGFNPQSRTKPLRVAEYVGKHKKQQKKAQQSNPIKPDLGGYMPGRNEFEFPFNDQAEVPVSTIVFNSTDTPAERQLKMDSLQVKRD